MFRILVILVRHTQKYTQHHDYFVHLNIYKKKKTSFKETFLQMF